MPPFNFASTGEPMNTPLTRRSVVLKVMGVMAGLLASAVVRPAPTLPAARLNVRTGGLNFPLLSWGVAASPPVLLLHGFPQDPWTWEPVAAALAGEGYWVLAPWQRGYAASNRAGPYTFATLTGDCVGLADALGLHRVHVAGFGIGGAVAWMLAASHPERVRSITSIRFPHPAAFAQALQEDPEQRRKWQALEEALGAGDPAGRAAHLLSSDAAGLKQLLLGAGLPPASMARYVAHMQCPGALQAALSWEQAISLPEFSQVPPVTAPALLLWNEGPGLAAAAANATGRYVQARYQQLQLPANEHFVLESSPAAVREPLTSWLQGVPERAPKRT